MPNLSLAQEPLPPPPPAKDYFPRLWKDFISTEGGFKVRYPGDPKESVEPRSKSTVLHSFWYGSDKFIYYTVNYRDLPNPPANQTEAREFLKGERDLRMTGVEGRMKLLSEEEITRDGYPAILLEIQLFGDRRLRELDVIRGARHYHIMVITLATIKRWRRTTPMAKLPRVFLIHFI